MHGYSDAADKLVQASLHKCWNTSHAHTFFVCLSFHWLMFPHSEVWPLYVLRLSFRPTKGRWVYFSRTFCHRNSCTYCWAWMRTSHLILKDLVLHIIMWRFPEQLRFDNSEYQKHGTVKAARERRHLFRCQYKVWNAVCEWNWFPEGPKSSYLVLCYVLFLCTVLFGLNFVFTSEDALLSEIVF